MPNHCFVDQYLPLARLHSTVLPLDPTFSNVLFFILMNLPSHDTHSGSVLVPVTAGLAVVGLGQMLLNSALQKTKARAIATEDYTPNFMSPRPSSANCSMHWFTQRIDHFTTVQTTYQQVHYTTSNNTCYMYLTFTSSSSIVILFISIFDSATLYMTNFGDQSR
jgi:hypothetical protein